MGWETTARGEEARQHMFQMMCRDKDDVMSCFIIARGRFEVRVFGRDRMPWDGPRPTRVIRMRQTRAEGRWVGIDEEIGVEDGGRDGVGRREGRIVADASDS